MWAEKLSDMTLHKVLQAADEFLPFTFVLFMGLPLACWFCAYLLRKKEGPGLKRAYVLLLFFASFPAIAITLFAAYISFFSDQNLPDVSLFCYILPFCSFVIVLVLTGANRDLLFTRRAQLDKKPPEPARLE